MDKPPPIRLAISGVPGTGKTTLARAFAARVRSFKSEAKNVELCSEYARRYIAKYGTMGHLWEQIRCLRKQIEWEDACGYASLVVTDSPIHLAFFYATSLVDSDDPKSVLAMTDLLKELYKAAPSRYSAIFHLGPVLKPVNDGVRSEDQFSEEWRAGADERIRCALQVFTHYSRIVEVPARIVNADDRVDFMLEHLQHARFRGMFSPESDLS